MQDSTVTLIVSLAGIAGTVISALAGYHYAGKARKSAYQEQLFSEQLSILKKIHLELGHVKSVVPLLRDKEISDFDKNEKDARVFIANLIELSHEASATLPSELWVDLNRLINEICNFLGKPVINRSIDDIRKIASDTATISVASRRLLGVDEMTMETTKFITSLSDEQLITEKGRAELKLTAENKLKE